ncbi:MAG: prolyl oligopeptidase family serine peptidase, partial [Planctomycetaceae bacterium]|nr:prolyl oligopeptidase family serine peptidase [Planctomycetaceae bacterium]
MPALLVTATVAGSLTGTATAQQPFPSAETLGISEEQRQNITSQLEQLQQQVVELKKQDGDLRLVADVEVYAKAAEWILRHNEFFRENYAAQTLKALETGLERAKQLAAGESPWTSTTGTVIRGYYSDVDGSVQPYALTVPEGVESRSAKRWPLHVNLHGRGSTLNEVSFIARNDARPLPEGQDWVQLDVFGRTNNAYRWAGETDVFEAIRDVNRTVRIDSRRIVLRGFSMGGAGAWHLGLHHPSKWCSVGPGAGFVDFYKYQKQEEQLPEYQHQALHIYDAVDYVLNAANVPVCTYGGENDAQLVASTSMVESAEKLGVDIKLLIGPGVGHKFHPDSFKEFMAFHREKMEDGRPPYPGSGNLRFVTWTLKYNRCDWLRVEEMLEMYKPAIVQSAMDRNGTLKIRTQNVAVLHIARDVADLVEIDGKLMKLRTAADGLLPGVYFELGKDEWYTMDYDSSRIFPDNLDLRKRNDLQGPIDDAFMQPFVCVKGTGTPWSEKHQQWADWTLARFDREFDKWMRGRILTVNDTDLTDEQIADRNLILFGDPGSNAVLKKIVDQLPVEWTKDGYVVQG